MEKIRVYHSPRSPYSRLGLHVISRAKLDVKLIPFTGPPDGVPFNDPTTNKLKLAYARIDVGRMTSRMGLALSPPDPFDVDMTPAYRAAVAAEQADKGLSFALAVSEARWAKGQDISDVEVLKACAGEIGWSESKVEAAQSAASVDEAMKEHRELIKQDGVFGVPFAVMGPTKYWGHDRFELLVEDASAPN